MEIWRIFCHSYLFFFLFLKKVVVCKIHTNLPFFPLNQQLRKSQGKGSHRDQSILTPRRLRSCQAPRGSRDVYHPSPTRCHQKELLAQHFAEDSWRPGRVSALESELHCPPAPLQERSNLAELPSTPTVQVWVHQDQQTLSPETFAQGCWEGRKKMGRREDEQLNF